MSDYCKQCSIKYFGEDFEEHKGHCEEGRMFPVLCEGCGPIYVNHLGECVSPCHCEEKENDSSET